MCIYIYINIYIYIYIYMREIWLNGPRSAGWLNGPRSEGWLNGPRSKQALKCGGTCLRRKFLGKKTTFKNKMSKNVSF